MIFKVSNSQDVEKLIEIAAFNKYTIKEIKLITNQNYEMTGNGLEPVENFSYYYEVEVWE